MGCLFGGLLAEYEGDVCLLEVREEQVAALNAHGVHIVCQGNERVVRVRAVSDLRQIPRADLALIFVKHHQTEAAAHAAADILGGSGYALTLQNGMGNAEIIADIRRGASALRNNGTGRYGARTRENSAFRNWRNSYRDVAAVG